MLSFFYNHYEKIILASMLVVFAILLVLQVNVVQTVQNRKVDNIINQKEPPSDQSPVDFTQAKYSEDFLFSSAVSWTPNGRINSFSKHNIKPKTDMFCAYEMSVCPFCKNLIPASLFPPIGATEVGICPIIGCKKELKPRLKEVTIRSVDEMIPVDNDSNRNDLPDDWERENKVFSDDSTVVDSDPDGDGFTTREEYLAKTNPVDSLSHPKYITKLSVREVKKTLIRYLMLDRITENGSDQSKWDIQFSYFDRKAKNAIFRIGDEFSNQKIKYKIDSIQSSSSDAKAPKYDIVKLVRQDNKETIVCVVKQRVYEPKETIVLAFPLTMRGMRKRIETSVGETITLGNAKTGVENIKVLAVKGPKSVEVQDLKTQEKILLKEYVKPAPAVEVPPEGTEMNAFGVPFGMELLPTDMPEPKNARKSKAR